MSISMPALFQIGVTCVAFGVVCFGFANWKRHYMRYFFCVSVTVFLSSVGYVIERLAPDFESAFIGARLAYLGAPYLGLFALLFAFEYVNYVYKPQLAILLALFPVTVTALVFTWPLLPLVYADVQRVETVMGPYLKVSPGALYLPYFIYNFGLIILALLWVMRHLMSLRLWKTWNTVVFSACVIIVIGVFLLRVAKVPPEWLDPLPFMEVIMLLLVVLHIRWFQEQEWHSIGRELAIENIKDAFILLDDKRCFLDANETALRYFPELRSFRIGVPLAWLGAVADTLLETERGSISLVLNDAQKHYFRVSRSNMVSRAKIFVGQAIMLYDETERETLIKELHEAGEKAERTTQAKSLFLTRTSHEIRTPMNAVIGMTELLLREELPPDVYDEALEIRRAGYMLLPIINDILDFSRIESGKLEITEAEYQFTSLINDVISIIRVRLGEKRIRFATNIDSHIPTTLIGDEPRLRQILLNLLNNAVKYTDEGSITLTVDVVPVEERRVSLGFEVSDTGLDTGRAVDAVPVEERRVSLGFEVSDTGLDTGLTVDAVPAEERRISLSLRFEVSDTGRGIKAEDMSSLFTEFTRLDNSSGVQGTGLGLVIARQFARLMGGDLTARSEYGKGSVFTALIPQRVTDAAPFAAVKSPELKSVLLFERRSLYAASIAYTLNNLTVPYTLVTTRGALLEALKSVAYGFIFVPSLFLEQTSDALRGYESRPTLISLSSLELGQSQRGVRVLVMPAYALSIANILNDVSDSKDLSYEPVVGARFIAPESRVLIVDDVMTNLKVVRGLIAPYKTRIDCCTSGAEALRLVREKAYDLVFMDHMMPEMNGVETLKAIRALGGAYFEELPIVALTANAMKGMRQQYLDYGFQDYLMKPVEIARLDAVLARWIPREKQDKNKGDRGGLTRRRGDTGGEENNWGCSTKYTD